MATAEASEAVDADVVARVSLAGTLALVQALEARGGVVVKTGDGVNTAQAMRSATIGVAMGGGAEAGL